MPQSTHSQTPHNVRFEVEVFLAHRPKHDDDVEWEWCETEPYTFKFTTEDEAQTFWQEALAVMDAQGEEEEPAPENLAWAEAHLFDSYHTLFVLSELEEMRKVEVLR